MHTHDHSGPRFQLDNCAGKDLGGQPGNTPGYTARAEDLLPLEDLDPRSQLAMLVEMLHSLAEGSYGSNDSEFWDPPYDSSAVSELEAVIDRFLDRMSLEGADPIVETHHAIEELFSVNERTNDMLIDVEEEAEILTIFHSAWRQAGYDSSQEFPDLESLLAFLEQKLQS